MKVVALSGDLMFTAAARAAVERVGGALRSCGSPDEAIAACRGDAAAALVVDLRERGLDIAELATRLREGAPGTALYAGGPHVHTQSLAAAEAAGCDAVFTRGELERKLVALLVARGQ